MMLSVCKVNQSVPDNKINLMISSARCIIYKRRSQFRMELASVLFVWNKLLFI